VDSGVPGPRDGGFTPIRDAGFLPGRDAGFPPGRDAGFPPPRDAGFPRDAGPPPRDAGPPRADAGFPTADGGLQGVGDPCQTDVECNMGLPFPVLICEMNVCEASCLFNQINGIPCPAGTTCDLQSGRCI
jgi:hypothetical protein